MLLYDAAGRQQSPLTPPGNQLQRHRELTLAMTADGPNAILPQ